jgi:CheY-like chemotaxis protein
MESIGTLASGVAHDLNNILSPILMSAAMLRDPLPAEEFESLVSTIEESALRGAQIVKQVLTFARGIEGERVPVQPKHLLREMERIAFQTFPKNITISNQIGEDLGIIEGDVTQLHQVLMNLCVNARDAMSSGGTLTMGAENFDVDVHYAAMLPDAKPGQYVRFTVKDTGTGIAREILDKIYDPFFTTKEVGKGTGLGLSTALGIVKSHGGFITVASRTGEGTTFRVHLPVAVDAKVPASSQEEAPGPRGEGERILVVDDEESIRKIMTCILTKNGYEVICAGDGAEAVALFAVNKAEIAVVLTDVSMPVLDGVGAVRAIRRIDPAAQIIACTGYEEEPQRKELASLSVAAFLTKPYRTAQLLRTLREVIAGRLAE